ncbi:MAG: ABC transporter ATP-binding protein [Desulfobulbus sp.]|nr:ABC transporter ATP-binding protein [Desulfobulbus sp.]
MVVLAVIEMAGIASIMPFIAVVASPGIIEENRWLNWAYNLLGFTSREGFLFFLGMLVLGMLLFSNLFKAFTTWATLRFDNELYYTLSRRLLARYIAQPYVFFVNRNTSEMGKNVMEEARRVIVGVISPCMQMCSSLLISLFIFTLLFVVNYTIAISIILVLGASYSLVFFVVRRYLARIGEEQVISNAMKFKAVDEVLSGIKDLKILGRTQEFLNRFGFHARRHARHNASAGTIAQMPRYALEVISFGGILLIILSFLKSEHSIQHIVPLLALYAFAGYRLLPALQQVFANATTLRFNLAALDVVYQDLAGATRDRQEEEVDKGRDKLPPLPFTREIVLQKVRYYYPDTTRPALNDVDLVIKSNTTIGFVGPTGSGKTTLVDLILGLLSAHSGEFLVDGVPVQGESVARWQRNLGYVPQQIFLSDDTITRNIAFGIPDKDIDMEAVRWAARIANLDEYISKELPLQYETVIGDRGVRLSGGQRQRIGIARALYRDPKVLILDEATSALDGVTEEAVMDALRTLSRKKTIIMIAHRLTTVQPCDVIYLLEQGKIVDHGTFDELRASSEWFRHAAKQ